MQAVEWCLFSIFWTSGQICTATSRLLVQDTIADTFYDRLRTRAQVWPSASQCILTLVCLSAEIDVKMQNDELFSSAGIWCFPGEPDTAYASSVWLSLCFDCGHAGHQDWGPS